MEDNLGLRRVLTHASSYDVLQRLIGGYAFKRRFLRQRVRVEPGQSLLDLGCGTGFTAAQLPQACYLGLDLNPAYVTAAQAMGLNHARFMAADCVSGSASLPAASYDWILTNGLLHHLSGTHCRELVTHCARLLKPGGRLLGFEPVWHERQSWFERFVMRQDRGGHVLDVNGWERLLRSGFADLRLEIAPSELNIPYSLVLFECRR